ncbi:MAG: hypothetical protein R3D05_08790 [Dongiaceae bacterium]
MLEHKAVSAALDHQTVAAFLRHAIDAAEGLPRARLHRRLAAPAGIPLELWFDDEAEADVAAARLVDLPPNDDAAERARLYTLNGSTIGYDTLPPWDNSSYDPAKFHAALAQAGLCAAFPFHAQLWLAFDLAAGVGLQLARSLSDRPVWFGGSPLRHHIHWLLRARGWRIAHAGSLGRDGRGILLLGHGGAGKSSTTIAGLAAGLQTVGDDYMALRGTGPAVALPLFRIVKQDRAGLERIAGLAERLAHLPPNWMKKIEFDPSTIFPGCLADKLQIDAIVVPRLAHAPIPRFAPASPGEAMRALMRTNLYQYRGEPDDGMEYYAGLLRALPVYQLDLSDKAPDNGTALAEFIASLRRPG